MLPACFLQALEGEAADVDSIYSVIADDKRHTDLRLLMNHESPNRQFENWSIGFEHLDDSELQQSLEGYKAAVRYPLVSPKLVRNGTVAETLLGLYNRN